MKKIFVVLIVVAVLFLYLNQRGGVYSVKDGRTIPFRALIQQLRAADVIMVGELHSSPESHALQYRIIRALQATGEPLAIGLEMFRAEDQQTLDTWVAGDLDRSRFILRYYQNWRMPWPLYSKIFLYAREHRIPLVGLNIPEEVSSSVAKNGFGSLTRAQRKQIPSAVSCNVDARYRAFISQAYSDHDTRSERSFNNFCEAQLLWDRSMAWHLAAFHAAHPKKHIVVLTGIGHAWRRAIPEQLSQFAELTIRIVLPEIPDDIDPSNVSLDDADYVVSEP